jgi:hypothetical protein
MPANKGMLRCEVKCGALRIKDVPLPAEVVTEAAKGNDIARKQIVANFIKHLKQLPIYQSSKDSDILKIITYDGLTILPPAA